MLRAHVAIALGLLLLLAPAARAAEGPPLQTEPALLRAALSCLDGLKNPDRPVVLLVHGTGTSGAETWTDGLGKTLPQAGFDWCMVELPDRAMGDIQTSSEYVVAAVRELRERGRRKVDLIGHSQGAVEIRWAVRFWPDVRAAVEDLVTLAGANQGVESASVACSGGECAPAIWQMRVGSALEGVLNKVPAPPGPSYTAIYSNTDELVQPASAGAFEGASNVLLQDICPGRPVEHAYIVFDAAAVVSALDALRNPGPADLARIPRTACTQGPGPGIDPAASISASFVLGANALQAISTYPRVREEPPLRGYASDAPGAPGTPGGGGSPQEGSLRVVGRRSLRSGAVRLRVRVPSAGRLTITDAPRKRPAPARFRRVTRRAGGAGTLTVVLKPAKAGRRALARRGAFTARIRLTFARAGESTERRLRNVRFRRR